MNEKEYQGYIFTLKSRWQEMYLFIGGIKFNEELKRRVDNKLWTSRRSINFIDYNNYSMAKLQSLLQDKSCLWHWTLNRIYLEIYRNQGESKKSTVIVVIKRNKNRRDHDCRFMWRKSIRKIIYRDNKYLGINSKKAETPPWEKKHFKNLTKRKGLQCDYKWHWKID